MKYLVKLKRTEIYTAQVEVEADDEEQAEEKALANVEPDDWEEVDPYAPDSIEVQDIEEAE